MTRLKSMFAGLIVASVLITGCASVTAVHPGTFEPNKSYKVSVGKVWTSYPVNSRTKQRNLTIDGLLLNQLTFGAAIKDGESLIGTPLGDREKLVPTFRSDMGGFEIAELVADSFSAIGMIGVDTTGIRPEKFGTLQGFRFEFSGAKETGLEYSGTVKAGIEDGTLHIIIYYAPTEYYYELHADEVEKILASVSLL